MYGGKKGDIWRKEKKRVRKYEWKEVRKDVMKERRTILEMYDLG